MTLSINWLYSESILIPFYLCHLSLPVVHFCIYSPISTPHCPPWEGAPVHIVHRRVLKEIAPATISRWIISTIKLAYQLTGNSQSLPIQGLSSISAHEVRALATSWATYKGVTLQEIIQAVEWKSHTIFSQFYLRDCCTPAYGMSILGLVVAATSVVYVFS
jgi:hypothetical protein